MAGRELGRWRLFRGVERVEPGVALDVGEGRLFAREPLSGPRCDGVESGAFFGSGSFRDAVERSAISVPPRVCRPVVLAAWFDALGVFAACWLWAVEANFGEEARSLVDVRDRLGQATSGRP